EALVDEQSAPSVLERAHDWMDDRRIGGYRPLPGLPAVSDTPKMAFEAMLKVVLGCEPVDQAADRLRQRLVGRDARRPQRVATVRRQSLRGQYRAERRRLDECHVGMPVVVVGNGVRPRLDQGDFRYALDMAVNGMDVQLAETAGEVALRGRVKRLILEEQHMALRQGPAQALDRPLGQRSRQIDSRHQSADGGRQASDSKIRGSIHVLGLSEKGFEGA